MSQLPVYNDLESKGKAFKQVLINTKADVEIFIEELRSEIAQENNRRFIYRGVTDAKYKLFSSAQRHFAEKELNNITSYENLITGLIENALKYQNGLLRKYFSGFGIPYDVPVLSFLQHYGAPTPLLDWTYNLQIALFFSIDGLQHSASNSKIDNYFSIYSINKNLCGNDLINVSDYLSKNLSFINGINDQFPDIDASKVLNENEQFRYEMFNKLSLFFVSDFERSSDIPSLTTQTNLNIINQEGLFIFNGHSTNPLESLFGTQQEPFSLLPKINSYDIHKSLYYYVLNKITEVRRDARLIPLTREFIYPQEELIAKKAFQIFLAN